MHTPFDLLEKRVAHLGNHHQKYIHTILQHKDTLVAALESSGKIMQVHLWRSSFSPGNEMQIIARLSSDETTKVQHLSCYYALQFLHMNFRNLDILELDIASGGSLPDDYYNFMMQVGKDFRYLTTAYLENLIDVYIGPSERPEFFICSVGTRADQDDIDIGVVTADGSNTDSLNQAFLKITQNMLVFATPLHMYLSEHIGKKIYTTTFSEYKHLLNRQIQDVVIISELLNAKFILGNNDLFSRFQNEVISKYFYHKDRDIRFHEGFLRGILGEARALLIKPLGADAISPKEDVLRILKFILYAKKSILNIDEVNAWDIMNTLIRKEPRLSTHYQLLFKATSFLETFKFLLQMFVIQEDTFRLDEIDGAQLSVIADRMGYQSIGTVGAWDQLIIDYYRYVKEARKISDLLIDSISVHLSKISRFVGLMSGRRTELTENYTGSLPVDFVHEARFFKGTKYWDDLLTILAEDKNILEAFVSGFEKLPEPQQEKVIKRYVEWAYFSPLTMLRFITIFTKNQWNDPGTTIAEKVNLTFLKYIGDLPYIAERFCLIYSYYPQYIHEYLQFFPEAHYEYLDHVLTKTIHDDRLKPFHDQLKDLSKIHQWSSQYFHRFLYRVIYTHPEYLKSLTNRNQLYKISSGLLAMVDRSPNIKQKKKFLADYYDLEFLRVGIGTMHGIELSVTNQEYSDFCDHYMKKLFDICTKEIDRDSKAEIPGSDTFAILFAGGRARGKAYDDDYDLIALVDTDDETVIKHATRVMAKMNREILKRGVLPHYRLGEILNGYVSPISKITTYLQSDGHEAFIDLSQLLGARMIIGSEVMRSVLYEKILYPFIFSNKSDYIRRMIDEVRNRQETAKNSEHTDWNVKETRGGLRDIEAVALMLKAYLGTEIPIMMDFFKDVRHFLPELDGHIDVITQSIYQLLTFRDLYWITVASEDSFHPDYLYRLARVFRQYGHPEWGETAPIIEALSQSLEASAKSCDAIISFLQSHID